MINPLVFSVIVLLFHNVGKVLSRGSLSIRCRPYFLFFIHFSLVRCLFLSFISLFVPPFQLITPIQFSSSLLTFALHIVCLTTSTCNTCRSYAICTGKRKHDQKGKKEEVKNLTETEMNMRVYSSTAKRISRVKYCTAILRFIRT